MSPKRVINIRKLYNITIFANILPIILLFLRDKLIYRIDSIRGDQGMFYYIYFLFIIISILLNRSFFVFENLSKSKKKSKPIRFILLYASSIFYTLILMSFLVNPKIASKAAPAP